FLASLVIHFVIAFGNCIVNRAEISLDVRQPGLVIAIACIDFDRELVVTNADLPKFTASLGTIDGAANTVDDAIATLLRWVAVLNLRKDRGLVARRRRLDLRRSAFAILDVAIAVPVRIAVASVDAILLLAVGLSELLILLLLTVWLQHEDEADTAADQQQHD